MWNPYTNFFFKKISSCNVLQNRPNKFILNLAYVERIIVAVSVFVNVNVTVLCNEKNQIAARSKFSTHKSSPLNLLALAMLNMSQN